MAHALGKPTRRRGRIRTVKQRHNRHKTHRHISIELAMAETSGAVRLLWVSTPSEKTTTARCFDLRVGVLCAVSAIASYSEVAPYGSRLPSAFRIRSRFVVNGLLHVAPNQAQTQPIHHQHVAEPAERQYSTWRQPSLIHACSCWSRGGRPRPQRRFHRTRNR